MSYKSLTPAAVLVPIVMRDSKPHILYTVRTDDVLHHKGEVCFPGGRSEKRDPCLQQTAIRETHEEIGILPEQISILGELDGCSTISGYSIKPVVGVIKDNFQTTPCKREVKEIFYLPVSALEKYRENSEQWISNTNQNNMKQSSGEIFEKGPRINYKGYVIWGATAIITHQLLVNFDFSELTENV